MARKAAARPLGSIQASVLRCLREHGGWRPMCGWVWDTAGNTQRILDRLVLLGHARTDGKGRYWPARRDR